MKRILAALSGKVEKMKMERKINRVKRAIETATDNAQDEIERIEEKKAKVLERLPYTDDTNGVISEIANLIGDQEEQEEVIARLKKVENYINEEIEVEEEEKK